MKKRKLRNGRQKAIFGFVEAAGSVAAAGIQALATANAARQQAEATTRAAQLQSDALLKQNENATKLQEQRIAFDKRENELERDIVRTQQLNEQIQQGNLNRQERFNAGRVQVRNGGRKRLRNVDAFLRGFNSPTNFEVTDGGGVIPLGITPNGKALYELVGNDHEHYHKAKYGTTYKSGVGIKFPNGEVIEGEGDQGTGIGELLLVGKNDAKFISKHTLKGFNPRRAVMNGMNPDYAANIQENIKDRYGISDDGTKTPVERSLASCGKRLRYGGASRRRADFGTWYGGLNPYKQNNFNTGITGIANMVGWGLTALGNRYATRQQIAGNNAATNIMVDAYNRMKGIDLSLINKDNYKAAHAMASLQAPIVDTGAERANIERARLRSINAINQGTTSSAAAQYKSNTIETNAADALSNVENEAYKRRHEILRENAERLTDVSKTNAALDTEAARNYNTALLEGLKYNSEVKNNAILGAAEAQAGNLTTNAQIRSQNRLATMAGLSSALKSTGEQFTKGVESIRKTEAEKAMAIFGSSPETLIALYSQDTKKYESQLKALYNMYKDSKTDYGKNLANTINSLLS